MAISSLGTGSGLDLNGIISGLVGAERAPTEQRLVIREQTLTAELSGYGAFKSSLNLFQGSLSGLLSTTAFDSKSVSVADTSVFTANAESFADPGNYDIEVTSIARAQSLATSELTPFDTVNDTVGTGTLSISFGTTGTGPYSFDQDTSKATQTITVSAENNNTTLSGLRDYINDGDYGIQATIVNDGNGYRLLLSSENTGAANSMEITVTGDGDGDNNDNSGLSQLAFNALAQGSAAQTVAASDAALTINGLDITRDTNTVTGAINGVTLNLLKEDIGSNIRLSITEDTAKAESAISEFVQSYNGLIQNVNVLTSYDAETREAGILNGDSAVRNVVSRLKNILSGGVSGLTGSLRSLADIGITTNSIDGTLALNKAKLSQALQDDPEAVEALFAKQGTPTDSDIRFLSASDDTQVNNYAVNITALASQGGVTGTAVNTLTIGSSNDNFDIKVDGLQTASITLAQATYASGDDLAAQIQAQINDAEILKDAGASVTVTYDGGGNTFSVTSNRYGSESTIEFVSVDTTTSNDLGFSVGSGTTGVDVAGTINGQPATGSGQTLTSDTGDSKGLVLNILAGSTGARGTVSFSRGVADTLDQLISEILQSDGVINAREDGINQRLDDIAIERERLELRITSLEARLVKQFTALDALIAQFNSTSGFLAQQLANLPKPNSIGKNN